MRWWAIFAVLAAPLIVPVATPGTAHACSCAYGPSERKFPTTMWDPRSSKHFQSLLKSESKIMPATGVDIANSTAKGA